MRNPRLILLSSDNSEREFRLTGSASIGRASDNLVYIGDEMVSLYHAVIEEKRGGEGGGGGFWLSDLGSVYGTTVNGRPIKSEYYLRDGDLISVGGAAMLRYSEDGAIGGRRGSLTRFWDKGISPVALAAGAAMVLVVVVVILALVKLLGESGGGDCGNVRIVNLSPGAAVSEPIRIQVEASNPRCVRGVSYRIAGRQFARPLANPFEA